MSRFSPFFLSIILFLVVAAPALAQEPGVYTHTLTSGKLLVVPTQITFGEIIIASLLAVIIAAWGFKFVFNLVYRE